MAISRRTGVTVLVLATVAPLAGAKAQVDADTASVAAMNRRIAEANAAIERGNAERLATWQAEKARVAAENARREAAFARQQADHEADMAQWRARTAAMQAPVGTRPAAMPKIAANAAASAPQKSTQCHMEPVTGTLARRVRVCTTRSERDESARVAQRDLDRPRASGCGQPGCD